MRLTIVRHAKSSWREPDRPDHDRTLNARGRRDGPRMAAWMSAAGVRPDWAWISTARRTRETATMLLPVLGLDETHWQHDARIYLAEPATLLDVLRETPPECRWPVLVGHNPGVTEFVNLLAGEVVHPDLPTLAVVTLDLRNDDWPHLAFDQGHVASLMTPKRLPDAEPGDDDD